MFGEDARGLFVVVGAAFLGEDEGGVVVVVVVFPLVVVAFVVVGEVLVGGGEFGFVGAEAVGRG